MTEAKHQLELMLAMVRSAAEAVKIVAPVIDRYKDERDRMESVGPILAPSLFQSRERQETDAVIWPVIEAAREFASAYERAKGDFEAIAFKDRQP